MTEADDLDDLLAPRSPGDIRTGSREAIFRRTERSLAHSRQIRRIGKTSAVAAIFLAGGLGGWLAKPANATTVEVAVHTPVEIVVPVSVPVPVIVTVPEQPPSLSPDPATPAETEVLAEQADDPGEAARLYRLAGDRYLNDLQDYGNASRCYRLFILRAGDSGLSPRPGDTWLLTSLKNAAYREKFHVVKTDG